MIRQHLGTILWLRWRMTLHQVRRAGALSAVILAILASGVAALAAGSFLAGLLGGIAASRRLPPEGLMLVWDGLVVTFLFMWVIGLVAELQRSEVLALQKLLHLPISLTGAFVVNYAGSLASLSMAVCLPGMIGLGLALVAVKGPAALLVFPLLASFLFMVTALSYQFQGWLASLMVNKRRRRTVVAAVSITFLFLSQVPNLINSRFGFGRARRGPPSAASDAQVTREDEGPRPGGSVTEEHERPSSSKHIPDPEHARLRRERWERALLVARRANLLLPPGWLPYGVLGLARGHVLPALLGALGAGLIGALSLRRSYRTTLRLYSGHFTSGAKRPPATAVSRTATAPGGTGFLERDLPAVSEGAAAVALAGFRSLTRAPEAKMALLTPVILLLLYGSMLLTGGARPPEALRPLVGLGAIAMVLLSVQHFIANQFGLDRDGFRAVVLSPVPRRDVLLGKNLALAPVALGMGLLLLAVAQAAFPMRIDHLLATMAELGSAYLLLCMVANLASILTPVPLASGSLRPAHPRAGVVLAQLGMLLILPILIGLAVLPLGLELLLGHLGWLRGVPVYLICSLPELAAMGWLYDRVIGWQGGLLQSREQQILAVVTTKVE